MSQTNKEQHHPEFTGIRALLWPIHNFELKKFIPLALIMFCLLFNYTVLRDTKDTLVVNNIGAHAIPYLKGIAVTIAAIAFVIIYSKLTNILSRSKLFYSIVTFFLAYFALFGFVLFPNIDAMQPSKAVLDAYHANYPSLSGIIDMLGCWVYSSFYVMSEIWGSAMIALVFWQFANHVVRFRESKRFYGLFAVIGNVALILSGSAIKYCSTEITHLVPAGTDPWLYSIYLLMAFVIAMGVAAMYLYRFLDQKVLTDKRYFDPEEQAPAKKKKSKPGLSESFKIILQSPELLYIAILIMAYGVSINLAEVQWKHQLKIYCGGNKPMYNSFMGSYSQITGIFTILFGLFVGTNIIRKFSWFTAAVITPAVILIGGGCFFIFTFSAELLTPLIAAFNAAPVAFATFLGAGIIIISKGVKYTLFDPTKEMAYIPLDEELKTKGKAAVDVIGGRMGKAAGGWVQMALLAIFATKDVVVIAPYAFVTFAIVCVLWVFSVKNLSIKVGNALKNKDSKQKTA
ncbi:MAG: AAA family ATPase [Candidatus Puniceispirillum sp.]|nr:AAA family ATPase [Candidatus Pelagibacter sp.]MBA4283537.1 AAA family ATPase [Candidatus Puniceispirillum sp.]